jgi:hypothetical protein
MYLYADPGKLYGYGVFGGLDGTEWCPVPAVRGAGMAIAPAQALWATKPPALGVGLSRPPSSSLWGAQPPAAMTGVTGEELGAPLPCIDLSP